MKKNFVTMLGVVGLSLAVAVVGGMELTKKESKAAIFSGKDLTTGGKLIYDAGPYYYEGGSVTPEVKVVYAEKVLTEGKDYEITYCHNDIGYEDGDIKVQGQGDYKGVLYGDFEILDANATRFGKIDMVKACTIELVDSNFYIDQAWLDEVSPKVIVKHKDKVLQEGVDYTLSNAIDAYGKHTVIATGMGEYMGATSVDVRIKQTNPSYLKKVNIDLVDVDLEGYSFVERGTAIEPTVTVTDVESNYVLVEGKDYELEYSKNINVGTAKVKIKGIGEYKGSTTEKFYIVEE